MKKRITLHRVIVILFSITVFVNVMGGVLRPLVDDLLIDIFGPQRSELLEPSKFENLTTTCFDDSSLESCELVSLDVIRDRMQPELDKHNLTFIDYFHDEIARFGDIVYGSDYTIPEKYEKVKYLYVQYHVLIAKNEANEQRLVYVPFEIIKNSDLYIYHFPFISTLSYEDMLLSLESHLGESIIFDYEYPNGNKQTFKVILSESMFKPYKQLYWSSTNEIRIFTVTSLFNEVDENWVPYTSGYEDSIAITIVFTEESLIILNQDGMITEPDILFEYLIP